MTRVLFDDQIFSMQRAGGISRSFVSLTVALNAAPELGISARVNARVTRNEHALSAGLVRRSRSALAGSSRLAGAVNGALQPTRRVDLVHATFYSRSPGRASRGLPLVSTIHDMAPEVLPGQFSGMNPHRRKAEYIEASDALICVSETTRQDLVAHYPSAAGKALVIHHGVATQFSPGPAVSAFRPWRHSILFVGQRRGYKRFNLLVEALNLILKEGLDAGVIAVGGGAFSEEEAARYVPLIASKRLLLFEADDAELVNHYRSATVFVYPSDYEGFGMPVLEAFACGAPTVISDAPALLEVAQDAALVFPRGDSTALAVALVATMNGGENVTTQRTDLGKKRAAAFSWPEAARLHAGVYQGL